MKRPNLRFLAAAGTATAVSLASMATLALLVLEPAPASADPSPRGQQQGLRHGHRSKAADGSLLVWDGVLGIYLVPEAKDAFWAADRFYRYDHGLWLAAPKAAGPWTLVPAHVVPAPASARFSPWKDAATVALPAGLEVVFEPRLRVYRVAGRRGVFLHDAAFYRYDNGVWLEAEAADGPWRPSSPKKLPQVLRHAVPEPADGVAVTLPSGDVVVWSGQAKMFSLQGRPEVTYFDGSFFERRDDAWFSSAESSRAFAQVASSAVPQPVRARQLKQKGAPAGGKQGKGDAKAARKADKKADKKAGKKQGD